ncbi:HAUS augmin-like complex subunit 1 [Modicella reniformis]|uniref:HAUS augmin-like complex subunit 1 n=1 Tax=Modicella reniformis TaxID=1440133 RepID=A0A9P6LSP4_9FUNG|nr:HAUS augmin-like complex subunit 1 [Modicella reniformis]
MWSDRLRESFFSKTHSSEWSQIDRWLQTKYRNEDIPTFERTEESAKILLDLMRLNETQDAYAQEAMVALKRLSAAYQREDIQLKEPLQVLGLERQLLSTDSQLILSKLSELAMVLGISDTTVASYHQGLTQLYLDTLQYSIQQSHQTRRLEALEKRQTEAGSELDRLLEMKRQWTLERETKGDIEQRTRRRSTELNRIKTTQDMETLEQIRWISQSQGLDAETLQVTLAQLDSKEAIVMDLQEQLDIQTKTLSVYQKIPPDYTLAKLKLKEAELRLDELTAEHEQLVTDIAEDL